MAAVASSVQRLAARKSELEARIKALTEEHLKLGIGLTDPLVDREGFPLANVDVYRARQIRSELSSSHFDYKELMRALDQAVTSAFARASSGGAAGGANGSLSPDDVAFAVVDQVMPDSPAEKAGLHVGDLIVSFGSVSASNHQGLRAIAELVASSENQPVSVQIDRRSADGPKRMSLQLTPASWSGRGKLGCHLSPI